MGEVLSEMEESLYKVSYLVTNNKRYQCAVCFQEFSKREMVEEHIINSDHFEDASIYTKDGDSLLEDYRGQLTAENEELVEGNIDDHVQHALTNIEKLAETMVTQECDSNDSANDITSHLQIELNADVVKEAEVDTDDIVGVSKPVLHKLKPVKLHDYVCELCQSIFPEKHSLKLHMKEHEGDTNYSCDFCSKTFTFKHQLNCHRRGHLLERKFKCTLCDKTYKFKQQLHIHLLTHSGVKPFSCETCQKTFTLERQLQSHMKVHTSMKPFICAQCGKGFKIKQQLQNHELTHYDIKPFICEVCTKSFKLKQQLQNHQKVHDDVKPYCCAICGKSFKFKQQLQNHNKVHEGIKQFSCEFCQKEFMFKQQLQIHMKIHFGIKEYPCHICSKDFRTKQQLQKHLEMHERRTLRLSGRPDDAMSDVSTLSGAENSSEISVDVENPRLLESPSSFVVKQVYSDTNIIKKILKKSHMPDSAPASPPGSSNAVQSQGQTPKFKIGDTIKLNPLYASKKVQHSSPKDTKEFCYVSCDMSEARLNEDNENAAKCKEEDRQDIKEYLEELDDNKEGKLIVDYINNSNSSNGS